MRRRRVRKRTWRKREWKRIKYVRGGERERRRESQMERGKRWESCKTRRRRRGKEKNMAQEGVEEDEGC